MRNIHNELRQGVQRTVTMAVGNHFNCFERIAILRRFSVEEMMFIRDAVFTTFDSTFLMAKRFIDLQLHQSADPRLWQNKRFLTTQRVDPSA